MARSLPCCCTGWPRAPAPGPPERPGGHPWPLPLRRLSVVGASAECATMRPPLVAAAARRPWPLRGRCLRPAAPRGFAGPGPSALPPRGPLRLVGAAAAPVARGPCPPAARRALSAAAAAPSARCLLPRPLLRPRPAGLCGLLTSPLGLSGLGLAPFGPGRVVAGRSSLRPRLRRLRLRLALAPPPPGAGGRAAPGLFAAPRRGALGLPLVTRFLASNRCSNKKLDAQAQIC